jgi:hypothetical protein
MAMKCPNCGNENPGYVVYCGFCGGTIPEDIRDKGSLAEPKTDRSLHEFTQTGWEAPKYKRLVVILAVTSMFLLVLSLQLPWFTIHDEYTAYDQDGVRYPIVWQNDIRIHLQYYTYLLGVMPSSNQIWQTGEYWPSTPWNENPIWEVMDSTQKGLLLCFGLIWLLSIAAVSNSRWMTLILTGISSAACLFRVFLFAGRIGPAVGDSGENLQRLPLSFISDLFGEETVTTSTYYGSQVHEWSWHPGWGFYLACAAGMLLCLAFVLKWLSMLTPRVRINANDEVGKESDVDSESDGPETDHST